MGALNLSAVQFAHPGWLWLLPLLAIAGALLLRRTERRHDLPGHSNSARGRFRFPRLGLVAQAAQSVDSPSKAYGGLWRLLVLACLVLALAQPEQAGKRLPEPSQRRDIVFIVDNSIAMNLRDYVFEQQRVSRLAVLKGVLNRFLDKLPGERVSVILYADRAYTLVPLTFDHALVRSVLNRIDTGLAGRTNAIGDAVALAVKEAAGATERHRVLVLFSSAARPTGSIPPLQAARLAADRQLPLYTVAIGAGSAAAREPGATGLIYDPAELNQLRTMAEITAAHAYLATDTGELATAIESISRLERQPIAPEARFERIPLYHWPLLGGLLLLSVVQLRAALGSRAWS